MINEISPELVGKVNKARLQKPSKTPAAQKTLDKAVKKAWLKSSVGKIKEDSPVPANVTGPAVPGTGDNPATWVKKKKLNTILKRKELEEDENIDKINKIAAELKSISAQKNKSDGKKLPHVNDIPDSSPAKIFKIGE
jgi:hypothetical protein